jgi:4a-hydroxytetrahydrobiopterin dehydratase
MDLTKKHCVPCEGGTPPFSEDQENEYLKKIKGWSLLRDSEHKIRRQFTFKDFKQSLDFVNKVGVVAEKEQHHPDIYIFYNKVQLDLFTHAVGGLSENDFIMAAKIDQLK